MALENVEEGLREVLSEMREEMRAGFAQSKGRGKGKGNQVEVYRRADADSGDDGEEDALVLYTDMETGGYVYECKANARTRKQHVSEKDARFKSLLNQKVQITGDRGSLPAAHKKFKGMKGHITTDPDPDTASVNPASELAPSLLNPASGGQTP